MDTALPLTERSEHELRVFIRRAKRATDTLDRIGLIGVPRYLRLHGLVQASGLDTLSYLNLATGRMRRDGAAR